MKKKIMYKNKYRKLNETECGRQTLVIYLNLIKKEAEDALFLSRKNFLLLLWLWLIFMLKITLHARIEIKSSLFSHRIGSTYSFDLIQCIVKTGYDGRNLYGWLFCV